MSLYCDVALPVPLDQNFTYALAGRSVSPGARVLVSFAGQRLVGVVVALHSAAPASVPATAQIKPVDMVLDDEALLSAELLELARWVAAYYVAPLGEVLRGMLPLTAEVRRRFLYRIADAGRRVLVESARGASRRSWLAVADQDTELRALNYLENGDAATATALRAATGATKPLLEAMTRKKWLQREAVADRRDARRVEKLFVLAEDPARATADSRAETQAVATPPVAAPQDAAPQDEAQRVIAAPRRRLPRLNDNQLAVMAELAGTAGRALERDLRARLERRDVPFTTVATLVRRGLVRVEEKPVDFHYGGVRGGISAPHDAPLNESQLEAVAAIVAARRSAKFAPHLLYGVTGSGKTRVYIAAMREALEAGRNVLLLVPEIGLTPAMVGQLVAAFGADVALLHSQLSPDERAEQWHRVRAGAARVVIGTRSAVFAPLPQLGLILVDEEHDASYKQEETPRYHGRDTAVMRAKLLGIPVVLGSATPSLESWHNAERGRYRIIEMGERVMQRPLPPVELIDMRAEFRETGAEQLFARRLITETQATLDRGEQAIILLNRRGYSFVVMCRACGEKIECENCAISLTFHRSGRGATSSLDEDAKAPPQGKLICHYCGFRRDVPQVCPHCASEHLYFLGAGSQQGEERLQEIFPGARIGRMDRDTVRTRSDMETLLARLHSGEINLLVGTQMIAKGHDIHGVTLVGVVGTDFALGRPDFRSAERVFQLLTQVSGRAGRGDRAGRVLVQTYQPDHYVHRFALTHDFTGFAARESYFRRGLRYPPFAVLANVLVQSENAQEAVQWVGKLESWFRHAAFPAAGPSGIRVLGPAAAPIARLKRVFRYHFVLKAERRDRLGEALRRMLAAADTLDIPRRALILDVDPMHLS